MKKTTTDKKYYKYDKIYLYKVTGSGKYTKYSDAINSEELSILTFAWKIGYARKLNDAPRGGKYGEHFEILKYFSYSSLKNKLESKERRFKRDLASVLKTERVDNFGVSSDIGSIIIDGVLHTNFTGDGLNIVEVCSCNLEEFKTAKYITRRQLYSPNSPIEIVKFDSQRTIEVANCDVDISRGVNVIDNVIGYVIWGMKLKVFTIKED